MSSIQDQLKDLERLKKKGVITDDEYQVRRTAILNDTSVAPSKGGAGGIFKWGMIGCVVMLAGLGLVLVLAIVVIAAAVSSSDSIGGDDTRVAFSEGTSGTVETAGDVKNRVTITKITDPAVSDNQFEQPQPGFHYLTVAVEIENAGERETTGGSFLLRTTDGFEYDNTFVSGVGASDLNSYQQLTSGGRTNAVLAFEVRDGSVVEWLKFDPNPFASGDLYFDN